MKVLVSAICARGHTSAAIGMAELLRSRGHQILFAQRAAFKSLVDGHDFEFIPLNEEHFKYKEEELASNVTKTCHNVFRMEPMERMKAMTDDQIKQANKFYDEIISWESALTEVLEKYPDIELSLTDFLGPCPPLILSGKPYFHIWSANPLALYDVPIGFGLSPEDVGSPKFEEAQRLFGKVQKEPANLRKEYLRSKGLGKVADSLDSTNFIGDLDYPSFYHFPEKLDYHKMGKVKDKWMRIDSFCRKAKSVFQVPEKLENKPGKLVYFSLGSVACIDLEMMQQILDTLSKSPHRFIVSTGIEGDALKLYDNMWGDVYLDQIAVLEKVDLAIIHGGNNSFMEVLHHGKPMIVIPYFFDQIDNARRAVETGIGKQVLTWDYSDEKLLQAIEQVLNDEEMKEKVLKISKSMRESKSGLEAVKIIEEVTLNFKNNEANNNVVA